MRRIVLLAVVLVLGVAAAACGGKSRSTGGGNEGETVGGTAQQAAAGGCRRVLTPRARPNGRKKAPKTTLPQRKTYELLVHTNCGAFTIEITQRSAPHAAAAFVSLAKSGFFDGTTFHRIVPGFVIQGGDPTGSGTGGPGFKTVDKPKPSSQYYQGVVAMAKTQTEAPGTAGSQFFIVTGDNAGLPPEYAIIGRVTRGLPVVLKIGQLGNAQERPTQAVVIQKIVVRAK